MATPRAGTSRSASTASSRSPPTASRCSSAERRRASRATVLSRAPTADGRPAGVGLGPAGRRRDLPRAVPAGLADLRAGRSSGSASSASSSPGHRRRPRAQRAARRGLRVVGARTRARPADGRAPVHLGRPARRTRPTGPRRGGAHEVHPVRRRSIGVVARRPGDPTRRPPCAARSPSPHSPTTAGTLSTRAALRSRRRHRAVGRLRRRRAPRRRRRRRRSEPPAGPDRRAPPSPRPRSSPPASAARSGSRWPGTCRSSSSGRAGAGGSATRRDWGRTGARALDLARHALDRGAGLACGDRGLAGPDPRRPGPARLVPTALFNELYFLVDGGTFWEAGEVGGPEPDRRRRRALRPARVHRLPVLRHGRRRLLRVVRPAGAVSRSWSCAASATCWRPSPSTTRRIVTIEASGLQAPRKVGWTVPARRRRARPTTRSIGPTGTASRTSTSGRTSGRSSCSRSGATRSPPGREAGDALIRDAFPTVERGPAPPRGERSRR